MGTHSFTILIADRNPHVREFLQREFESAGYKVQVARDGKQVLSTTASNDCPGLVVLDLDMPHVDGLIILEKLLNRKPSIPVVVHTFLTEYEQHPTVRRAAAFWEKRGNNIEGFKAEIERVIHRWYLQE